jgi:hypothetical protein
LESYWLFFFVERANPVFSFFESSGATHVNPSADLVRALGEAFGPDKVKVHTEFHVQVVATRGVHDIWMAHNWTGFKLKLSGNKKIQHFKYVSRLTTALKTAMGAKTDLTDMEDVLRLTTLIRKASQKKQSGVFVDAGWKNGKAKIAVIYIHETTMVARSFEQDQPDSLAAEIAALQYALQYNPLDLQILPPVFCDCTGAIQKINNPRVQWISRINNVSDSIGNMRGKL